MPAAVAGPTGKSGSPGGYQRNESRPQTNPSGTQAEARNGRTRANGPRGLRASESLSRPGGPSVPSTETVTGWDPRRNQPEAEAMARLVSSVWPHVPGGSSAPPNFQRIPDAGHPADSDRDVDSDATDSEGS